VKTLYKIQNGVIVSATEDEEWTISVYSTPTAEEKLELGKSVGLDKASIEGALDPDESPRMDLDFTDDLLSVIWKTPESAKALDAVRFGVASVGLFFTKDKLTMVGVDLKPAFQTKDYANVKSTREVLLRYFLSSIHHFTGHLRVIKMLTAEIQQKLNKSFANEYFLQMFALSESLIYYQDALEGSALILQVLRRNCEKAAFSQAEIDLLENIAIEHEQCRRQTDIYSSVLSGLMDARGSIINNNMSTLLKNLTLINVIFLPLNLIAGIGGMSEFSMITTGIPWFITYPVLMLVMGAVGFVSWVLIVKFLDRR